MKFIEIGKDTIMKNGDLTIKNFKTYNYQGLHVTRNDELIFAIDYNGEGLPDYSVVNKSLSFYGVQLVNKEGYLNTLKIGDKIVIKKKFNLLAKSETDIGGIIEKNFTGKTLTIKNIIETGFEVTEDLEGWTFYPSMISLKKTIKANNEELIEKAKELGMTDEEIKDKVGILVKFNIENVEGRQKYFNCEDPKVKPGIKP